MTWKNSVQAILYIQEEKTSGKIPMQDDCIKLNNNKLASYMIRQQNINSVVV